MDTAETGIGRIMIAGQAENETIVTAGLAGNESLTGTADDGAGVPNVPAAAVAVSATYSAQLHRLRLI